MILRHLLLAITTLGCSLALAGQVPCGFSGKLRRTETGELAWYSSEEMKKRAVRKVDVGQFLKQADVKGTDLVDVLVDRSGKVICVHSTGHPLIRVEVEKAVSQWTFRRAEIEGQPTAYLGRMRFDMCNILCGERGPSVTLLE